MKKVIDIQVDEELSTTTVSIQVPDFHNFGQRLGELEGKASEAILNTPPDPEELEDIKSMTASLKDMTKTGTEDMQKKADAMPDGPEKQMMLSNLKMMKQLFDQIGKF